MKIATRNNRNQKTDTFFITRKGFTFTMESCGKNRSRRRRRTGDNRYELSGYLVNVYPLDESNGKYYIECYQCFSDSGVLRFNFNAVITDEFSAAFSGNETYDALTDRIAKTVLNHLNTCESDSNLVCKVIAH